MSGLTIGSGDEASLSMGSMEGVGDIYQGL